MKLVKCLDSFLIGLYLGFSLTLLANGVFVLNKFIPKYLLEKKSFYMDGNFYEIKKK